MNRFLEVMLEGDAVRGVVSLCRTFQPFCRVFRKCCTERASFSLVAKTMLIRLSPCSIFDK
ncbi:MAG: hypothetical protein KatS3mg054_0518 [Chloroflexus sp.]|nr:MAG: hypothetical protein KatS3mg054_0518 [Chloroflexus sp.]GIV92171.1 MAG: hypothetical protein KatS3mg056_0880 [Chloroflexus sp.]